MGAGKGSCPPGGEDERKAPVEAPAIEEAEGEGPADLSPRWKKHAESEGTNGRTLVDMAGRRLPLSNLERSSIPPMVYKARSWNTTRIAPFVLPIVGPALTLNAIQKVWKRISFSRSAALRTIRSGENSEVAQHDGEPIAFCLVNDLATLIWVENLRLLSSMCLWPGPARRRRPTPWSSTSIPAKKRTSSTAPVALILRTCSPNGA